MKSQNTRHKKQVKTVDEYIRVFPREVAVKLKIIRKLVKKSAPKVEEVISYHMPAYKLNGMLLYFAAYEHHIGFYPYPSTVKAFQKYTTKYKTAKGSIQFPLDKPLPLSLIRKIVKFRIKEKLEKKFTLLNF